VRCRIKAGKDVLFESDFLSDERRLAAFDVPAPADDELQLEFESRTPDITSAHGVWLDLRLETEKDQESVTATQ